MEGEGHNRPSAIWILTTLSLFPTFHVMYTKLDSVFSRLYGYGDNCLAQGGEIIRSLPLSVNASSQACRKELLY